MAPQTFVWWEASFYPRHTNVCNIFRLWEAISSLVFHKSLSILLIVRPYFQWNRRIFPRLQNSSYFGIFKYTRAVKQKVWKEAENRERDATLYWFLYWFWGNTDVLLSRFSLTCPCQKSKIKNKQTNKNNNHGRVYCSRELYVLQHHKYKLEN